MHFEFMNPAMLVLLPVVAFVYIFINRMLKKKRRDAIKFSAVYGIKLIAKSVKKRDLIFVTLTLLSLTMLIIALADPHIPLAQEKEGVNVVLAIDSSGSMQATDYKPSRFEAAKQAAKILINNLQPKDYVGAVIFESGATTAAYLTPYKERVIEKLNSLQPKEGRTAIGDGLSLAVDMAVSIPNRKRIVILLSDGVNNAGVVSPEEAIQFAKSKGVQVYTVGMGSEEPVVIGYDWFGRPQYAELDEALLKKIAKETNGLYFKSVNEQTLSQIYATISQKIEREKELVSIKDWFIFLALVTLLVEIYLRYGKYRVMP